MTSLKVDVRRILNGHHFDGLLAFLYKGSLMILLVVSSNYAKMDEEIEDNNKEEENRKRLVGGGGKTIMCEQLTSVLSLVSFRIARG